ncbi:hypothetical protein [Deefgea sp. CFH1-16]|uniref:hypothetical protein n=1 Tax=Deefgea sp. CFH1-16 TaxID=2675457 RepID=UPI0015F42383|nr:hypothetical protein [Deefgea sp. CFH1-16]MBM5573241.1 hypothetical protein [Deefgea sp. CFH1-16]
MSIPAISSNNTVSGVKPDHKNHTDFISAEQYPAYSKGKWAAIGYRVSDAYIQYEINFPLNHPQGGDQLFPDEWELKYGAKNIGHGSYDASGKIGSITSALAGLGAEATPHSSSSFKLHAITAKEMRSFFAALHQEGKIDSDTLEQGQMLYSFQLGVDVLNRQEAEKNGHPYVSALDTKRFDLFDHLEKTIISFESSNQNRAAHRVRQLLTDIMR